MSADNPDPVPLMGLNGQRWVAMPADKITGILHLHSSCTAAELREILNLLADRLPGLGVTADAEDPHLVAAARTLLDWLTDPQPSPGADVVQAIIDLCKAHLPEEEVPCDS